MSALERLRDVLERLRDLQFGMLSGFQAVQYPRFSDNCLEKFRSGGFSNAPGGPLFSQGIMQAAES